MEQRVLVRLLPALFAAILLGCPSPPLAPDAGADARRIPDRIDASVDGLHDAGPICDGECPPANTYAISWECQQNCILDTPLRYQDRLDFVGDAALFHRSSCGDFCDGNIAAQLTMTEDRCSVYQALVTAASATISICREGPILIGHLEYSDFAGDSYWVMYGVPLTGP